MSFNKVRSKEVAMLVRVRGPEGDLYFHFVTKNILMLKDGSKHILHPVDATDHADRLRHCRPRRRNPPRTALRLESARILRRWRDTAGAARRASKQGFFPPIPRCREYVGEIWLRIVTTDASAHGKIEVRLRHRVSTPDDVRQEGEPWLPDVWTRRRADCRREPPPAPYLL